jgi:hypothetical protein
MTFIAFHCMVRGVIKPRVAEPERGQMDRNDLRACDRAGCHQFLRLRCKLVALNTAFPVRAEEHPHSREHSVFHGLPYLLDRGVFRPRHWPDGEGTTKQLGIVLERLSRVKALKLLEDPRWGLTVANLPVGNLAIEMERVASRTMVLKADGQHERSTGTGRKLLPGTWVAVLAVIHAIELMAGATIEVDGCLQVLLRLEPEPLLFGGKHLGEDERNHTGHAHQALLQVQLVVEFEPTGISPARFEDRELRVATGSESGDRALDAANLRAVQGKVLMTPCAPSVVHSDKRCLAPSVILMTLGAGWHLGRDLGRVMSRAGMTRLAFSVDTSRRYR